MILRRAMNSDGHRAMFTFLCLTILLVSHAEPTRLRNGNSLLTIQTECPGLSLQVKQLFNDSFIGEIIVPESPAPRKGTRVSWTWSKETIIRQMWNAEILHQTPKTLNMSLMGYANLFGFDADCNIAEDHLAPEPTEIYYNGERCHRER